MGAIAPALGFPICAPLLEYLCSPHPPPPPLCRRGCTVPGEGWSPAETEHSGEAPRRRRSHLRWHVRCASPFAAARNGTRISRGGHGESRRRSRCAPRIERLQRAAAISIGALRVGGRGHDTIDDDDHDHGDTRDGHAHDERGADTRVDFGSGSTRCFVDEVGRDHGGRPYDTGSISARDAGRHRERSGHVVRRGTAGPVRQPDAPIRYGVDSDEHSEWGAHDVRG